MARALISILLLGMLVCATTAQALTIIAGQEDAFASPQEPAAPSAAFTGSVTFSLADFDSTTPDLNFAHTFSDLPTGIVGATLRTRVKALDFVLTEADGIVITFIQSPSDDFISSIVYKRTFGVFEGGTGSVFNQPDPGLAQSTPWLPGNDQEFILDLSALPLTASQGGGTLNLLPLLNSNGFFDILIGDETSVDFLELQLQVQGIPEAPSASLLILGMALLAFLRRRSGFNRPIPRKLARPNEAMKLTDPSAGQP